MIGLANFKKQWELSRDAYQAAIERVGQSGWLILGKEVSAFEAVQVRREVRLRIDARQAPAGLIRELAALVSDFPGEAPVYVALETSVGERTLALGPEYRVKPDADFLAEVRALLGEAAIA